jgi:membrane associated rhomboid family serine protease
VDELITWIFVIIAIAVFQIISLILGFPDSVDYFAAVLLLLTSLGMLYRIRMKQKKGERERLARELAQLKNSNP